MNVKLEKVLIFNCCSTLCIYIHAYDAGILENLCKNVNIGLVFYRMLDYTDRSC